MTTLQEAAQAAMKYIRSTADYKAGHPVAIEAAEDLSDALAQQVERKNCPQPEICGSKECEFCRDTAAPAQQPVAYITDTEQGPMVWTPEMYDEACTYCDDEEFPVPLYTAAPAPVAQQGWKLVPVEPTDEMLDAAQEATDAFRLDLANAWSAMLSAAPAPQAQPMTDPCKTCSHFKEGNLPGVRIHDETCYECRSYWGNKWEAA